MPAGKLIDHLQVEEQQRVLRRRARKRAWHRAACVNDPEYRQAQKAAVARYRKTEAGKAVLRAAKAKYRQTAAGKASHKAANAKYYRRLKLAAAQAEQAIIDTTNSTSTNT
jgi:hypothetical protein